MLQIDTLSAAQYDQLSVYRERWWQQLSSTQPLKQVKAEEAVCHAYRMAGLPTPKVVFFKGPLEFQNYLKSQPIAQGLVQWGAPIVQFPLIKRLSDALRASVSLDVWIQLQEGLDTMRLTDLSLAIYSAILGPFLADIGQIQDPIHLNPTFADQWLEQVALHQWQEQEQFWRQELERQPGGDWLISLGESLWEIGQPLGQWVSETVVEPLRDDPFIQDLEAGVRRIFGFFSLFGLSLEALSASTTEFYPVLLDYSVEVLGCSLNTQQWSALRSLYTHCGPLLTFEKACFIFERPTRLSFDDQGRMHGEGEPALAFDDGYGQYCFQGVQLPPKYGPIHPNLWKADWILQEPNAELRRVLILGIGYSRICQELNAVELDAWREYTLLRIDQPIDVEPVFLLKMTCPSTGYIHATRVPPYLETAREAIRWVNWEIDPEDFSVET